MTQALLQVSARRTAGAVEFHAFFLDSLPYHQHELRRWVLDLISSLYTRRSQKSSKTTAILLLRVWLCVCIANEVHWTTVNLSKNPKNPNSSRYKSALKRCELGQWTLYSTWRSPFGSKATIKGPHKQLYRLFAQGRHQVRIQINKVFLENNITSYSIGYTLHSFHSF